MLHPQIDPNDFAVVLALSRAFGKAVSDSLGLSVTDFRILVNVVAYDGRRGSDIASSLGLSRSTVSMSLAKLRRSRFISPQIASGASIASTSAGRRAFDVGHEALYNALVEEAPAIREGERETLNFYMAMVADRLGAPTLSANGIDMVILYLEANARTKQLLKQCCTPRGMSPNCFVAMCAIMCACGPARPKDIAESALLSRPVVTQCCSNLTNRGFVEVSSDDIDGRGKTVSATTAGIQTFHEAYDAFWTEFTTRTRSFNSYEVGFFRAIYARR